MGERAASHTAASAARGVISLYPRPPLRKASSSVSRLLVQSGLEGPVYVGIRYPAQPTPLRVGRFLHTSHGSRFSKVLYPRVGAGHCESGYKTASRGLLRTLPQTADRLQRVRVRLPLAVADAVQYSTCIRILYIIIKIPTDHTAHASGAVPLERIRV